MGARLTPPATSRAPLRMSSATQVGNLLGAVVTYLYFRFIDPVTASDAPLRAGEIVFFVVAFAALSALGLALSMRWGRPLVRLESADRALVRQRALAFPFVLAGVSLIGWLIAGMVWGALWPALEGTFSWPGALRRWFGITVVGGSVTCAFVFFTAERQWRRQLASLFPEGGAASLPGVPRLPVRRRLLAAFGLAGILPLSLLGILAYRRVAAAATDPTAAPAVLDGLLVLIAFILAVGVLTAVALAALVADSVARPLRRLEAAMDKVAGGDLDGRCPVVSSDEIGAVAEGFNRMLDGLREREVIKETFGRYVTREIRDEILAGRVSLEGQLATVTILFADLRDFTPWVEATEPREVVRSLNEYFGEMEASIRAEGGLILQFIGDEIEAVFGAPLPCPDHAARAVRAALDMRYRLAARNERRAAEGRPALRHGIGIHTGTVLAGNVGSPARLSFALVGDAVNVASRIQGLTRDAGVDILVSGVTAAALDGVAALAPLPSTRVKGRTAEVEVLGVVR